MIIPSFFSLFVTNNHWLKASFLQVIVIFFLLNYKKYKLHWHSIEVKRWIKNVLGVNSCCQMIEVKICHVYYNVAWNIMIISNLQWIIPLLLYYINTNILEHFYMNDWGIIQDWKLIWCLPAWKLPNLTICMLPNPINCINWSNRKFYQPTENVYWPNITFTGYGPAGPVLASIPGGLW